MAPNEPEGEYRAKQTIVEIGRRMWERGWVAANDGNVSYRLSDREILCTPSGVSKGMMAVGDLVKVDPAGRPIGRASRPPSSEMPMHLRAYALRPDVRAIVHAHPPHATAHAIAGIPLADCVIPEIAVSVGSIPIAPYGTPSTDEIPDRLAPLLPDHNAWLLENHGALTVGRDLFEAYFRMESIELFAQMMFIARGLGRVNPIAPANLEKLRLLRARVGGRGEEAGCRSCGACGRGAPGRPSS